MRERIMGVDVGPWYAPSGGRGGGIPRDPDPIDVARDQSFHQSEHLIEGTRLEPTSSSTHSQPAEPDLSDTGMPDILAQLQARTGFVPPPAEADQDDTP